MDDVQCNGTESNLLECRHNGWENHDCQHYEDAGCLCADMGNHFLLKFLLITFLI